MRWGRNTFQLGGTKYYPDGTEKPCRLVLGDTMTMTSDQLRAALSDSIDVSDLVEKLDADLGIADAWAVHEPSRLREAESAEIAQQVEEFLAKGGTITVID